MQGRRLRRALTLLLFATAGTIFANPRLPLAESPFGRVATEIAAEGPRGRSRVGLLNDGRDALLLRVHLIRAATRSIEIQTFIWTNDEVGRLMIWELIEAARRGVKVRIIADHMFSDQDPDVVAFLATVHPNFELRHYRPAAARIKPGLWRTALSALRSFRDVNQRMHSKVMVVDDAVLITGGRNIENSYFHYSPTLNYHDRDVVVVGPLVREATKQFEAFWQFRHAVPSRALVDVATALERGTFRRFDRRDDYDFGGHFADINVSADDAPLIMQRFLSPLLTVDRAEFLYDLPGKSRSGSAHTKEIAAELGRIVHGARRSVFIQTPYLVLSHAARELLGELRDRSPRVSVTISTNSFASTDNLYAYSANYRLRNEYIEGLGLMIHELKPRPAMLDAVFPAHHALASPQSITSVNKPAEPFLSLHAKCLVIDDDVAFVGSYNLDPRSERLNTEVGLLVHDRRFAAALRDEIERDIRPENSWVINRRRFPLRLDAVNGLISGVLSLTPVEVWPLQNTSSFELLPGHPPVAPGDRDFHDHYRDVGAFPGAPAGLSTKEVLTRVYKAFGSPLTPIL